MDPATIHTFRARETPPPQSSIPFENNIPPTNPFLLNKSATTKDLRDHPKTLTKQSSSKEVSIPIQIRQNKRKLAEDLAATKFTERCPNHAHEPCEFYSFTDDSLLCTKCLVTGKYSKHEVLNLRKANEKINSVLKEVINGIHGRAINYNQWQRNLLLKKNELQELIPTLQKQVKESFFHVKVALETKEKDIIEKINQIKISHETQYETLENDIRVLLEEISMTGQVLQHNLSNLNELSLCSYYSQKHSFIIDFLKNEEIFRAKHTLTATSPVKIDEDFNVKTFHDAIKTLADKISALSEPVKERPFANKKDYLKLSINSITKLSSPVSTPSATFLTPTHKEDHVLRTLPTETSLPLTTKDTEAPISTMRQREERSSPSKMSSKGTYLEGYFDQLEKIRKRRTMDSASSQVNDALSRSSQAISDTERRLQSRRKATGPSSHITEAYQKLQDSRREIKENREKSPVNGPQTEGGKSEPSARIIIADLLARKNPVLSPSRSFLSPTLKQRPESGDFVGNQSGSMNRGTKSFLMENLASYKSPDSGKNKSVNISMKLTNVRRER